MKAQARAALGSPYTRLAAAAVITVVLTAVIFSSGRPRIAAGVPPFEPPVVLDEPVVHLWK